MPDDYDVYERGKFSRVGQIKGRRDGGYDVYEDGNPWKVGEIRPRGGSLAGDREFTGGVLLIAAAVILLPLTLIVLIFWGIFRLFARYGAFTGVLVLMLILLGPPLAYFGLQYSQGNFKIWMASDREIVADQNNGYFDLGVTEIPLIVSGESVSLDGAYWHWRPHGQLYGGQAIQIGTAIPNQNFRKPPALLTSESGASIVGEFSPGWILFSIPERNDDDFELPVGDDPPLTLTLSWGGTVTTITVPPFGDTEFSFWERLRWGEPGTFGYNF